MAKNKTNLREDLEVRTFKDSTDFAAKREPLSVYARISRRAFLCTTLAGVLLAKFDTAQAVERLSPHDRHAKAMGFVLDASQIDTSRFPDNNGNTCAGCRAFGDSASPGFGACEVYGGRLVPAGGWCAAFIAR